MMAINSYDYVRNSQIMCDTINATESKIFEMERRLEKMEMEFRFLHFYLDKMGIPSFSEAGGKLQLADRVDLLATQKNIEFTNFV